MTSTTPYHLSNNNNPTTNPPGASRLTVPAASQPYYVENSGVPPAPYAYQQNNVPLKESRRSGGGFCLGCTLTLALLCCVLPGIALVAGYILYQRKMSDMGGMGNWQEYLNGDGEGGTDWSQYLSGNNDDQTISSYIEQFTNGDDDQISGYVSQYMNGDDDQLSSYFSNWGDDGDGGGD